VTGVSVTWAEVITGSRVSGTGYRRIPRCIPLNRDGRGILLGEADFMKTNDVIFFVTAFAIILLDQITKYYINSYMSVGDSFPVIQGFFNIAHVRNPGAAFGIFSKSPAIFRTVFLIAVTTAAMILILYYVRMNRERDSLMNLALSLIFGGAIGNLIDRIRFGEVIDFLDFYIGPHHWPAYNVADSAISTGAVLLIVTMIWKKGEKGG
jgi:signal peptidase II